METQVGVLSQIVGMAVMLLGGGIALGKLFSDNAAIKAQLAVQVSEMRELTASNARLEAESRSLQAEVQRVRDRLDQFVDGKVTR